MIQLIKFDRDFKGKEIFVYKFLSTHSVSVLSRFNGRKWNFTWIMTFAKAATCLSPSKRYISVTVNESTAKLWLSSFENFSSSYNVRYNVCYKNHLSPVNMQFSSVHSFLSCSWHVSLLCLIHPFIHPCVLSLLMSWPHYRAHRRPPPPLLHLLLSSSAPVLVFCFSSTFSPLLRLSLFTSATRPRFLSLIHPCHWVGGGETKWPAWRSPWQPASRSSSAGTPPPPLSDSCRSPEGRGEDVALTQRWWSVTARRSFTLTLVYQFSNTDPNIWL